MATWAVLIESHDVPFALVSAESAAEADRKLRLHPDVTYCPITIVPFTREHALTVIEWDQHEWET